MLDKHPGSVLVRTLLSIYSMDSFVFKDMNKACRDQDENKLDFYGPYLNCLYDIINMGEYRREEHKEHKTENDCNINYPGVLKRGLNLPISVLSD